jgi:tellurite methyltransferase
VDISAIALERLRREAADRHLPLRCHDVDLEAGALPEGPYELIVLVRYVNVPLYRELIARLSPRGVLLTEQHLETDQAVVGPRGRAFRLAPGALRDACGGLTVLSYFEGLVTDPDGRVAALAQLVARKPEASRPELSPEPAQ